ncbi:DUF1565 domain-containing protein [Pseudonocardia sp. MH-G8]|uniref:DUF1565 domain-containing protein n=1 Tax=Pseudonocardia sp. MH-G8 TaxID=1854588 RepID=UPI0013045125|nr:DUF1565 domain-containing protein [Pseudonocardia sp. MH-G8]
MVVVGVLAVAVVWWLAGTSEQSPPAPTPTAHLYVAPTGNDTGDGSERAPLRTIQTALDRATPGTQINLAPGDYHEKLQTKVDGVPDAPIWIKGPESGKDKSGRYVATLYGTGRILSIDHSHYVLDGFTIDGQEKLPLTTELPTDVAAIDVFKDSVKELVQDSKLIYIGAGEAVRDVTGVTISNMFLARAGTECVRLRNNAHDNIIMDSVIEYCGMFGKKKDDGVERAVYHNGEGVYIGTSPKSDSQPMHANDGSSRNVVTRNTIRTFGSECFNVKENAHDNVFEDNICSDNAESSEFQGSNIELRGHSNIIRNNEISHSAGVSVKIKSDEQEYDKGGNTVQGNRMSGAPAALQFNSTAPPGPMCGNVMATDSMVFVNSSGDHGDGAPSPDITAPCG